MQHIVIDARFFDRSHGGIARYTQALIRELARLRSTFRFTTILQQKERVVWEQFYKDQHLDPAIWQATFVDIPHYSLAEQVRLPGLLTRLKPDLVHFTNFNHPLVWNRPFIPTIHDLTIFKFPVGPRQTSPFLQAAFRIDLTHALKASRHIITVSETSKRDFIERLHVPKEKISVTYEGIDDLYQPVNLPQRGRGQAYLMERFGIRSPYVLFVNQWRPHKGIRTLLAAYQLLRDRYARLTPQLVLVGKANPHYPEILDQIRDHPYRGDIILPGFVDELDLPKLYQGAEVFTFPSLYEGFGLTPLEAMACGVPVLASDASCIPEILGTAAEFASSDDPSRWADGLYKLLTDRRLWSDFRARGLAHARRYSWQTMAQETLEIYSRVLSDRA